MRKNKQSIADDIENIKLGKSLKKLRKREKWTQAELGEILGLHQSAVSRLELGLQALNLTHLSAIARFLKCHPMEVMARGTVMWADDDGVPGPVRMGVLFDEFASNVDRDRLLGRFATNAYNRAA